MHQIEDNGLRNRKGQYYNNSHLGGLAYEYAFHIKNDNPQLANQLLELANSYCNLICFSLTSYSRMLKYFNSFSGQLIEDLMDQTVKEFNCLYSMKETAINFITIGKSAIDVCASIADLLINKKVKPENLIDIKELPKNIPPPKDHIIIEKIISLQNTQWFVLLRETRNRIIHRGAIIEFKYISKNDAFNSEKLRLLLDGRNLREIEAIFINSELKPSFICQIIKPNFITTKLGKSTAWVNDKFGSFKEEIDLSKIAHGLAIELELWDCDMAQLILNKYLRPQISNYSKIDFTPIGSRIITHPLIGAFDEH